MRSVPWMAAVVLAAACHRQPAPVLEYGETVTYTSTADDPAPGAAAPAQATGAVAAAEPSPAPAHAASEPAGTSAGAEGAWTTTVSTAGAPAAPAEPPPVEPPPIAPPPERQWYKAKPW